MDYFVTIENTNFHNNNKYKISVQINKIIIQNKVKLVNYIIII